MIIYNSQISIQEIQNMETTFGELPIICRNTSYKCTKFYGQILLATFCNNSMNYKIYENNGAS